MSKLINAERRKRIDANNLTEEQKRSVILVKDVDLLDDPDNGEIYGAYDAEKLADSVKRYGFQGVLVAYPVGNGKYMIESGHRRRVAGALAGMKEFPVYVTEPPKSDAERVIRLNMANSLNRDLTPLTMSRMIQKEYDAHADLIKQNKEKPTSKQVISLVCEDFDISQALYYKYRALSELSSELQSLVEEEIFGWAAISEGSTLPKEKQKELYDWLVKNIQVNDEGERVAKVSAAKIKAKIKDLRRDNTSKLQKSSSTMIVKETEKAKSAIQAIGKCKDQASALSFLRILKEEIEEQIKLLT